MKYCPGLTATSHVKTVFVIADVRKTIDDLKKVMTNFESRVEFTEDLQKMSDVSIVFSFLFFQKEIHIEKFYVQGTHP